MAQRLRPPPAELGSLDGRIAPADEIRIPATDEGLLRGDGVFEVIRVYDGRPSRWTSTSTGSSARAPTCGCRVPRAELEERDRRAADARGGGEFDGALRIVLTRGGRRLLLTEPRREQAGRRPARPRSPTRPRACSTGSSRSPTRRTCSPRGLRRSAASTRRCWSPRTGACSRRPRPRSSGWTRTARICTPPLERAHPRLDHPRAGDGSGGRGGAHLHRLDDLRRRSEAFLASTTREVQSIAAMEDVELEGGQRTREAAAALRARDRGRARDG